MADAAPSADDLLTRMNAIAPPSGGQVSTSAPSSSAPSSDDLLMRMNSIAPPPEATPSKEAAPSSEFAEGYGMMARPTASGADIANAFQAGTYRGLASVFNAPSAWFGLNPLIDTEGSLLTPGEKQAAQAVPGTAAAGQLFGQAVGTSPLAFAGPYVSAGLEAAGLGGAGLGPAIARGAVTGAGYGAAGNVLTAGEDPQASLVGRALSGAVTGSLLGGVSGGIAGKVGDWLAPEATTAATPQYVSGVNPLTPEVAARANVRAATAPPETAAAGPPPTSPVPAAPAGAGPQSVGAGVTPPGLATLTPDEVNAYRATAEGNKLLENQRVGEPDRTAYIPDVTPNLAEQEQTVNAARELKTLGITSQDASQDMKLAAQANNDARTSYWNDTTRSPVDVQRAEAARDLQAQADLKATWANKTDADALPVQDAANQILAGPDGKRKAVQSAVNSVLDELKDQNGNLETDPELLYGVRKHIGDMLSKEGQRETPMAARATDSLITLRDTLDSTIEQAAPGFKQYLQNFSNASRPIDEMQVLQDATPSLFKGPNATLRYGDFQRFMKNVVDMRQAQGVNPYKSISDDTMQRLWNLRDDLRRSAGALELARAPGSDTAPNIIDAIKQYGKLGGSVVVDAAASHLFGPAGPLMVRGTRAMLAPITAARTARAQQARVREMLYPANPLTPPPGGNPLTPP